MALVRCKTVDDGRTKGVICTAETILDLKHYANQLKEVDPDYGRGACMIVECLEELYMKIRKDY